MVDVRDRCREVNPDQECKSVYQFIERLERTGGLKSLQPDFEYHDDNRFTDLQQKTTSLTSAKQGDSSSYIQVKEDTQFFAFPTTFQQSNNVSEPNSPQPQL